MTSPRVLSCLALSLPLALALAPAVAGASPSQVESPEAPPVAPEVVGGTPVEACGWAPTLERNCTASLVHPLAITTAQHCGPINQVTFTDAVGGTSPAKRRALRSTKMERAAAPAAATLRCRAARRG